MKIHVKFVISHLIVCLVMAVSFAKAQQPQPLPGCLSQCGPFCAALTSNFGAGGTGPFSTQTLNNLMTALPEGSVVWADVLTFQGFMNQLTGFLDPSNPSNLGLCQSSTYCSQVCSSSSGKSIAQKPTAPVKKAAPSK